ncbi:mogroside IE synthase-like [Benincasa hispida]|uniref:mogroside IE synthase-like n=1 Tax=Benincasa hispida TaxID=102211 RepID=UPI0018FFA919|nr:mogroside IE synthase-like [Benincasa hispida]XP_038885150.1 mogroside IE synthase-like [Benincasa hispida]
MEETTGNGVGRRRIVKQNHVIVFPFPRHGHISPMLQFSKRLISKGLLLTFLTTSSASQSLILNLPPSPSFHLKIISDVSESNVLASLAAYLQSFRAAVTKSLANFIDQALISSSDEEIPPTLIVYDSVMPWVQTVAAERGLDTAPFFTQSAAVNHVLLLVYGGSLSIPPPENVAVSLPAEIALQPGDLPAFPDDSEVVLKFMTSQFYNLENVKWIFINTFDRLESKVVNWMAKTLPIKTVGPTIPSAYLDGRLEDDKAYGLNVSKSNGGKSPIKWLDSKETASVVYISFGSLVILLEEQVKELTNLLRDTDFSFLWVLRESELEKLPNNFLQDTSERGLIVNWCCQPQVLSHKAVSCFVTHCGWNSTLEALSLGVPMVAIPQWVDQTTNAKFIADVWGVGIRVKKNEKGIATKEELEASIRKIVQGERANEFKQNSIKWKNLAKEAVDEGGTSDKHIEEFVQAIVASN